MYNELLQKIWQHKNTNEKNCQHKNTNEKSTHEKHQRKKSRSTQEKQNLEVVHLFVPQSTAHNNNNNGTQNSRNVMEKFLLIHTKREMLEKVKILPSSQCVAGRGRGQNLRKNT